MVPGPGRMTGDGEERSDAGQRWRESQPDSWGGREKEEWSKAPRIGLEQLKLRSLRVWGAEKALVIRKWILAVLLWHPGGGAEWAVLNSEKLFGHHGHMGGI